MRKSRVLIGVTSLALAATSVLAMNSVASAESAPQTDVAVGGRGAVTTSQASPTSRAAVARKGSVETTVSGEPISMPESYPYQPKLTIYDEPADDAVDLPAVGGELLGYDDLAPMLNDLMRKSDRVSTQVVGRSSAGRDLYLVTVTAPENAAQTAQQEKWKNEIKHDPEAAAQDADLMAGYKTPVWLTANIQGNEWEGTDASMRLIDKYANLPWNEAKDVLRKHRLYFSVTLNPDARVIGQRPSNLGLDPNRDMITNVTPEISSFSQVAQSTQGLYMADLHGYTGVLQVEPCGPPHGENYEYDLFVPHGYAIARRIEDDVVSANIPGNTYYNVTTGATVSANTSADTAHIKIPYRDTPDGWDDFPPVFSAQYAAYLGAVSSTIELPKGRQSTRVMTAANAVINKDVASQAIQSIIDYVAENSDAMLTDQIEFFRRGVEGAPKTALTLDNIDAVPGPSEWKPLWDVVDNQDPVVLPRAYVIPVGDGQRSTSDTDTLVNRLISHGIEVGTLDAATTVDGTTYPAGSYVVDMHQPMRGLANTLLDLGSDISQKVPSMYDISAWSMSYLWGSTVDKVGLTTDSAIGATTPVTAAALNGGVPASAGYVSFEVAGVDDVRALNSLLEAGATVSMLESGSAVVGPEDRAAVTAAAEQFDIAFTKATPEQLLALDDPGTRGLQDLKIAYVGNATVNEDWLSLGLLGFDDIKLVNAASLTADPTLLNDVDALWVGSNLTFTSAQAAGQAAVQAWVDAGHPVLGRGAAGFNASKLFGLVSGTAVAGTSSGNGIVAVDTPAGSLFKPFEQASAFIYPATWFTGLGTGVKIEQTYDATDPLLAGHWRPSGALVNGPANAAGMPSIVSAEAASGARSVVFGTTVMFRGHPKAGMSQAGRALFWAAPEGTDVLAPKETSVAIARVAPVTYPGKATVRVTTDALEAVEGTVDLLVGTRVVATGTTSAGTATLTVPGLKPGTTQLVARFTPTTAGYQPSVSAPAAVSVAKASSALKLSAKKVKKAKKGRKGTAKVTITFRVPNVPGKARIKLTDNGKSLRVISVAPGTTRTITIGLRKGKHSLRASFAGNSLVMGSSASAKVRIN
ncbi:MAG: M14 family metallopeptidase [Aeromicrobium sp.]